MKRLPTLLVCTVLTAACGSSEPGVVLGADDSCAGHSGKDIVTFADAVLQQMVQAFAGYDPCADVSLTCDEVARITTLEDISASQGDIRPVLSLRGLQNLTGLTRLDLVEHGFDDIGPLSGLTKLQFVNVQPQRDRRHHPARRARKARVAGAHPKPGARHRPPSPAW